MKITSSVYNLKQLNKVLSYCDAVILNTKELSLIYDDLDLSKAISLCKNNNVLPIIAFNKMIYPYEFENYRDVFEKYKEELFLITDIGLFEFAKDLGVKFIYNPETMIANYLDLEMLMPYFEALSYSNEVPFSNVIESYHKTNAKLFYLIFGHKMMFYSKRHLIDLYEKHSNIKIENRNLYIRELTRDDYFPIVENDNGTMIYRSYLISYLDVLDDVLEYGYLESLFMNFDLYLKVLKIYNSYNKKEINKDEAIAKINELNLNILDGFKYVDSVYQKEEF